MFEFSRRCWRGVAVAQGAKLGESAATARVRNLKSIPVKITTAGGTFHEHERAVTRLVELGNNGNLGPGSWLRT